MHLQRTIRRGLRLLAQFYADAARAHTELGCPSHQVREAAGVLGDH